MTSEQKKQITNALVSLVLSITSDSHRIDQAEATALSAALDFLAETEMPERLYRIAAGSEIINSTAQPDLYKKVRKFIKPKE